MLKCTGILIHNPVLQENALDDKGTFCPCVFCQRMIMNRGGCATILFLRISCPQTRFSFLLQPIFPLQIWSIPRFSFFFSQWKGQKITKGKWLKKENLGYSQDILRKKNCDTPQYRLTVESHGWLVHWMVSNQKKDELSYSVCLLTLQKLK